MAHTAQCWTCILWATCHRALNDSWPQIRMRQRCCSSQLVAPRLVLRPVSPREMLRHPVAGKILPEWRTSSSEVGIGKDCGWSERVKEGWERKRWERMACVWMISVLMSQVIAKSALLLGEIPRKQLGLCNLIPARLISVDVILKGRSTELGDCNSQRQGPAAQLGQGKRSYRSGLR